MLFGSLVESMAGNSWDLHLSSCGGPPANCKVHMWTRLEAGALPAGVQRAEYGSRLHIEASIIASALQPRETLALV